MPYGNLLQTLHKKADFVFKRETRDYVTVYSSRASWPGSNIKTGSSLQQLKPC